MRTQADTGAIRDGAEIATSCCIRIVCDFSSA
jgi:hypothetical protein